MGKPKKVRTPAGVKRFGAPIGTPIIADPITGKLKAAKKSLARLDGTGDKKKSPKSKSPSKPTTVKTARTKVERGADAPAPRRNRGDKSKAQSMRKRAAMVEQTKSARTRKDKINEGRLAKQIRDADATAPPAPDESVNPSSPEARAVAKKHVDKAAKHEPDITKAVGVTSMRHGAKMSGLEFRKKDLASYARKTQKDSEDDGISLEEAASGIKDGVRFTAMVDTENYWTAGDAILEDLVAQGHKVTKDKGNGHKWAKKAYRGRNVQLEDSNGVPYELQFHTPESFDAKMVNHGLFEEKRKLSLKIEAQKARIKELDKEMAERFMAVPVPPGTDLLD